MCVDDDIFSCANGAEDVLRASLPRDVLALPQSPAAILSQTSLLLGLCGYLCYPFSEHRLLEDR